MAINPENREAEHEENPVKHLKRALRSDGFTADELAEVQVRSHVDALTLLMLPLLQNSHRVRVAQRRLENAWRELEAFLATLPHQLTPHPKKHQAYQFKPFHKFVLAVNQMPFN